MTRTGWTLAAAAFALTSGQIAQAQPPQLTAQAVIDKAAIGDLITRYYNNFGNHDPNSFKAYYADDAEMVLGGTTHKGMAAIVAAYKGAGENAPQMKAYSFNILINNPLITVRGNTATARLLFTEVLVDKKGDTPHILTEGREFAHFVKSGGVWKYSKREIVDAATVPVGWTE